MRAFDERGADLTAVLQHNAGTDPIGDARNSGYIKCIVDLLNINFEETQ